MQHKDLLIGNLSVHENLLDQTAFTRSDHGFHSDTFSAKYLNLKLIHELQTGTLKHCLHNVMTPVSAMSGYLELIREHLSRGTGDAKLKRYSDKIAEGLDEVGFLLEQLHNLYKLDDPDPGNGEDPEVNLNWILEEVIKMIHRSVDLTSEKIINASDKKPIFIQADVSRMKLIVYNMISAIDRFCTGNSQIEIEAEASEESGARLTVRCTGETLSDPAFIQSFQQGLNSSLDETDRPTAINGLLISCQMARQIGGEIEMVLEPGPQDGGFEQTGGFEQIDDWSERGRSEQAPMVVCTLPLAQIQEFI